jgi:protein-S-isoprenylcysteine O-methyltransferase Ste14
MGEHAAAASPAATSSSGKPGGFAAFVFYNRRLLVGLIGVAAIGLLLVERAPWHDSGSLEYFVAPVGWACVLMGVIVRLWAIMHIGGHKSQKVVREGPYALVRNPLYFGSFLACLGIGVLAEAPVAAGGAVLCLLIVYMTTIIHEEKKLTRLFGPDYESYLKEVPRFFPRFSGVRRLIRDESVSINYRDFRRELLTTAGFVAAAIAANIACELVIERLQDQGTLPILLKF